MIGRMPVFEAEVDLTSSTEDGYHFLLLAAFDVALVGEDGLFAAGLSSRIRALVVDMLRDSHVRNIASADGNRLLAEGTAGHLIILQVRLLTRVLAVQVVILAEDVLARVAPDGQEVCS